MTYHRPHKGVAMNISSIISILVGVSGLALGAVPAQAQRYYVREVLKGLSEGPTFTYTPTYSTTFGNCTNSVQTAPIVSCKRSDGLNVANSLCGADRQTTPRACTSYACEAFKSGGHVSGAYDTLGTNIRSEATAKNLCETYAAKNGKAGACLIETSSSYHVYYVYAPTQTYWASYYSQNVAFCAKS